jgi:hypothetical protein
MPTNPMEYIWPGIIVGQAIHAAAKLRIPDLLAGALALTFNIWLDRPGRSSIGLLLIIAGRPFTAGGSA